MIVSPMLHRMELCRKLIKQQTHNELDILDDIGYIKIEEFIRKFNENIENWSRLFGEVSKVNKTLQPYARITRVTILENPLEMTTTKKIKRNYKK